MFFVHEKDRSGEEVKIGEKIIEGTLRKIISTGERIQLFQVGIKGGTEFPEHSHPNEQAGYIIQGKFEVNIGGEKGILEKGHYFWIPKDVPHSGFVQEDTIMVEIYSPPR